MPMPEMPHRIKNLFELWDWRDWLCGAVIEDRKACYAAGKLVWKHTFEKLWGEVK